MPTIFAETPAADGPAGEPVLSVDEPPDVIALFEALPAGETALFVDDSVVELPDVTALSGAWPEDELPDETALSEVWLPDEPAVSADGLPGVVLWKGGLPGGAFLSSVSADEPADAIALSADGLPGAVLWKALPAGAIGGGLTGLP